MVTDFNRLGIVKVSFLNSLKKTKLIKLIALIWHFKRLMKAIVFPLFFI